jgi:hypothetical protein
MEAQAGAFALTGQSVTLASARLISAAYGAFALTGQSVTAKAARVLTASYGAFVIAGQTADLTEIVYSPQPPRLRPWIFVPLQGHYSAGAGATNYILNAQAGTFTITGRDGTTYAYIVMNASAGTFALSGIAATLKAARTITASYGAFAITGQNATLVYHVAGTIDYDMTASGGTFGITGSSATLLYTSAAVPPVVVPVAPIIAGNGNLSKFRGYYYGQKPRKPQSLKAKKAELIRDLQAEERERQRIIDEEETKKRELARLMELVKPRVYHGPARHAEVIKSISKTAFRAIEDLKPIIARKEHEAQLLSERIAETSRLRMELERREKEIEEMLLSETL